jgi:hypothetical protein
MNIHLNPQSLTAFSKSLVGIIGTGVMLWQVPQVHDAVAPLLAAHPHFSSLVAAGVAVWGVLHNPVKP